MDIIGIKTDASRGYGAPSVKFTAKPACPDMDTSQKLDAAVLDRLCGRAYRIHILPRDPGSTREYSKTTRVYVQVPKIDLGMEHPPFGSNRGDGSDADKAWKLFNRLETKVMRTLIGTFLPLIREHTEFYQEGIKFRFSRHAGCSMCPCSPGFVADERIMFQGQPVDIWIEEVEPEPLREATTTTTYLLQAEEAARLQAEALRDARDAGLMVVDDTIIHPYRQAALDNFTGPEPARMVLDQPYSDAEVALVRAIVAERTKP